GAPRPAPGGAAGGRGARGGGRPARPRPPPPPPRPPPPPPARGDPRRLPDHVPAHPDPPGLGVLVVDAGVADVRRGHRDDLPAVRGVGQRLLVTGHPGVEHHLAERLAARAEPGPTERSPVFEHQDGGPAAWRGAGRARHQAGFPSSTVARPRRNVATTWPGRVRPANGELRLREACAAGSTAE